MILFMTGLILGILLISSLAWQWIIRPTRRLIENLDIYEKTGSMPIGPRFPTGELNRLQTKVIVMTSEIDEHRKSMIQLENAKQEFLSLVSHELRTPLTSIKGSLSLIINGIVGPVNNRCQNFLEIAQTEVDRLIYLVNDILDIAKLEAGQISDEKIWFDPHSILVSVQSAMLGLQQKNDVAVVIEPRVNPCEIFADPKRIQQLITNLVSNAIAHSPKKSMVIIGCDIRDGGIFRFYVQDHGKGISLENQKQIFKKFVQTTPCTQKNQGTGLGLAICDAIAKKHGGRVGVQSDIGKGSLFFFEMAEYRFSEKSSSRKKGSHYEAA